MTIHSLMVDKEEKEIYRAFENFTGSDPEGNSLDFTNYNMQYNDSPIYIIMGEFHYSRYPHTEWENEVIKIKMSGVNTIATYIFWNMHERKKGVFDYSGDLDLRRFVQICKKHGLHVVLRIGPFAHGEVRNGGIPDWLYGRPFKLRSNDQRYLDLVKRLYDSIASEVTGLYYEDGGPIVGIQLENEFMHCGAPWETTYKQQLSYVDSGEGGYDHMMALKRTAVECGMNPVFFSCTGWGSPVPEGEMLTMYGGYAFTPWSPDPDFVQKPTENFVFRDYHEDTAIPNACCEMGGGIQVTYYHRPLVPTQSVEAMTLVRIAGGANLLGYYVFHGGTNPEIDNIFYNEFTVPKKSYDFQAPIGECGQIRDSYRRLKYIFYFLKGFEELLVPMKTCLPKGASEVLVDDVETLRWAVRATSDHGFVFINNYQDHVETQDILNNAVELELEAESIRIPHESGFDMKSGECAILPFNLDMEGALLKSSTAQLITYIKDDDATVYFFFERDGMKAEYCFDSKTVNSSSGSFKENMLIFHPESGCDKMPIELESRDSKIKIVTLTHEEAMNFWLCDVWGRERIILSSSDVLVNDESIKFRSTDNLIDFKVYPDPKLNTQNQKDSGIFRMYETKLPEKKLEMTVSYAEDSRADIDFDQNILDGVDEIIMRVDYIGDTGNAFIDGKLISDDFCYEGNWEIGLRRFADEIIEHGMYIYISPIIKGTVSMSEVAFAFNHELDGEAIAKIRDIELIPIYSLEI